MTDYAGPKCHYTSGLSANGDVWTMAGRCQLARMHGGDHVLRFPRGAKVAANASPPDLMTTVEPRTIGWRVTIKDFATDKPLVHLRLWRGDLSRAMNEAKRLVVEFTDQRRVRDGR